MTVPSWRFSWPCSSHATQQSELNSSSYHLRCSRVVAASRLNSTHRQPRSLQPKASRYVHLLCDRSIAYFNQFVANDCFSPGIMHRLPHERLDWRNQPGPLLRYWVKTIPKALSKAKLVESTTATHQTAATMPTTHVCTILIFCSIYHVSSTPLLLNDGRSSRSQFSFQLTAHPKPPSYTR